MKNLNRSQLLFLFAYLRLVDLSLDRSRWAKWSELQEYFIDQVQPSELINYVKTHLLEVNSTIKVGPSWHSKIKHTFKKSFSLTNYQLNYIVELLTKFNHFLKSDLEEYTLDIEKLRIEIVSFYSEKSDLMLSKKDWSRLMKIEHFYQNSKISLISLKDFFPSDFQYAGKRNF